MTADKTMAKTHQKTTMHVYGRNRDIKKGRKGTKKSKEGEEGSKEREIMANKKRRQRGKNDIQPGLGKTAQQKKLQKINTICMVINMWRQG